MLLGDNNQIDHQIIDAFQRTPRYTAKELHDEITRQHRHCSLRSIYKELDKLIKEGVLVRSHGAFSLNLTWVFSLSRFAELSLKQALAPNAMQAFLPPEGGRVTWKFTDLGSLDRLWLQLIFALLQGSRSGIQFNWLPHYWFELLSKTRELTAGLALSTIRKQSYTVFGSGSYLERLEEPTWDRTLYNWRFPPHRFFEERSKYLTVIDTYILTVKLDKQTASALDGMFARISSEKDVDHSFISQTLDARCSATVWLENKSRKSGNLRRQFCNQFGLVDPLKA